MGSDITCFQEVKATPSTLPTEYNHTPGYDCFYALPNRAYSGVATICKKEYSPIACEIGFTGGDPDNHLGSFDELYNEFSRIELRELDNEGRVVITDHKLFILFNVYFPHGSGDPKREIFKMKFNRAIEIRIQSLIKSGRQIILVGDLNIAHREIDHCDPIQSNKELMLRCYDDHPPRKWFDNWISSTDESKLIDTFRYLHPTQQKAFTCWNTKINARPVNYGTRIDYIIVSSSLLPWITNSVILSELMGSDHCPVQIQFKTSIDGIGLKSFLPAVNKPALGSTFYWNNYGGKQKSIKSFLTKRMSPQIFDENEEKSKSQHDRQIISQNTQSKVHKKASKRKSVNEFFSKATATVPYEADDQSVHPLDFDYDPVQFEKTFEKNAKWNMACHKHNSE